MQARRDHTWRALIVAVVMLAAIDSSLAQAETRYYALDAASLQTSTIMEVCIESGRTSYSSRIRCLIFDDSGGALDTARGLIFGTGANGDEISVALKDVAWLKITAPSRPETETIEVKIDALVEGRNWAPRGAVKQAVLTTGTILNFEGMAPALSAERRFFYWTCEGAALGRVPFENLLFVELDRSRYSKGDKNSGSGRISSLEFLSGETLDLDGHTPALDLTRSKITYRDEQHTVSTIELAEVRSIQIEKCEERISQPESVLRPVPLTVAALKSHDRIRVAPSDPDQPRTEGQFLEFDRNFIVVYDVPDTVRLDLGLQPQVQFYAGKQDKAMKGAGTGAAIVGGISLVIALAMLNSDGILSVDEGDASAIVLVGTLGGGLIGAFIGSTIHEPVWEDLPLAPPPSQTRVGMRLRF